MYNLFLDVQVLKDGMQHLGNIICSKLGARMDSEPKRWRILGFHLSWNFSLFFLVSLICQVLWCMTVISLLFCS